MKKSRREAVRKRREQKRKQSREEGRRGVTLEWAVSQSVQTNTSVFTANS